MRGLMRQFLNRFQGTIKMFDIDYKPENYAVAQNSALLAKRNTAWQFLQENGLPTRRDEKWKYTNLSKFLASTVLAEKAHQINTTLTRADISKYCSREMLTLVFVDGQYCAELSGLGDVPEGVSIEPVMSSERLSQVVDYTKLHALSINDALFTSGIILKAKPNTGCEKRIELLYLSTKAMDSQLTCIQNIFELAACSKIKISEKHVAMNAESKVYMNIVNQIALAEGSTLNWLTLSSETQSQIVLTKRIEVQQAKASKFEFFNAVTDGVLNRVDIDIHLNEVHAQAKVDGVFLTKNMMHADHQINVTHKASHTVSDVCFKGVAKDKSNGIFNAKALVQKGIHTIKALQSNKNLLLDKTAQINTKPELEIYSDDVICAHGATVGQLDVEALFYLQSRGISHTKAIQMLTEGFVLELFERQDFSESEHKEILEKISL